MTNFHPKKKNNKVIRANKTPKIEDKRDNVYFHNSSYIVNQKNQTTLPRQQQFNFDQVKI